MANNKVHMKNLVKALTAPGTSEDEDEDKNLNALLKFKKNYPGT